MNQSVSWIEYATAVGSIATPILVTLLGAIGWSIRARLQRRIDLEEKLRQERVDTYNKILEPFIILLMTEEAWKKDPKNKNKDKNTETEKMWLSLDYRKTSFYLSLIGSDDVIRSYNDLMQYVFHIDQNQGSQAVDVQKIASLLGSFLLSIRKSMGNEKTDLDEFEMLEWFMKDAQSFRGVSGA